MKQLWPQVGGNGTGEHLLSSLDGASGLPFVNSDRMTEMCIQSQDELKKQGGATFGTGRLNGSPEIKAFLKVTSPRSQADYRPSSQVWPGIALVFGTDGVCCPDIARQI